jgi:methyl-accepting chemotaxis protein
MSTVVIPITAITAHANEARAGSEAIKAQTKVITDQTSAIGGSLTKLRGLKLTPEQEVVAKTIDQAVVQINASVNAVNESAGTLNASAASLTKVIPNTPETPFVSTGVSGTGTASKPGTDAVAPTFKPNGSL